MFIVYLLKQTSKKIYDISQIVKSFSIKSSKTDYARHLDFQILDAKTIQKDIVDFYPINPVELGDIIRITDENDVEIYRGIVKALSGVANENSQSYTSDDFGFYIARSMNAFKFYKQSVKECLDTLFKEANLPLGVNEAPTDVLITKLYSEHKYSDIIKDFIDKIKLNNGDDYTLEFREGVFNFIETEKSKYAKGTASLTEIKIKLYEGQNPFDFKQVILGVTYDESIEELYNKVKVVVESESKLEKPKEKKAATKKGDKKKKVKKEAKKEIVDLATKDNIKNKTKEERLKDEEQVKNTSITSKVVVQDDISIQKYGELMYVETIKADDVTNAKVFAENKLKELNRISSETKVEFVNCYSLESFDLIELIEPKAKLNGVYEVTSTELSFDNGFTKVNASLDIIDKYEVVEDE